jgi:hypothetical protein
MYEYMYDEDELRQLVRPVKYENTCKVIDQFVDLERYLKQKFELIKTTEVSNEWCNRVNTIGQYLYVGVNDNTIKQYNTLGECVNTYDNIRSTIVVKQANNGDIIAAGLDGLYVTNKDFTQWNLIHEGKYSDIEIYGNKFTALEYKECKLVTFELCVDKRANKWNLMLSFKIAAEHKCDWRGGGKETVTVDKENNVIVCSKNKLLVYSSSGKYIKTVTLLGREYRITCMDSKGILCDYQTGKLYCVNNILQMDKQNIEQYLLFEGNKWTRDMAIDCHGNMWILHGYNSQTRLHLTKYVPVK